MSMTPHGRAARSPTEPDRPDSGLLLARMLELHPKLIDLSLGRVEQLLEALGNPHLAVPPVIHIAGTMMTRFSTVF